MRRRALLSIVATCLVTTAACAGGGPAIDDGDATRLGGPESRGNKKGPGRKDVLKKAAKVGEKAEAPGSGGGTEEGESARAAGQPPAGSAGSSEIVPEYARRTASLDDPNDDAKKEGVTPDYGEIVKASIVGLGEDFRMTLTVAGDIPDSMPNDKTHFIVAFGITGERRSGQGYSFGAQCTTEGWQAYAGGKDDSGEFPGTFLVDGNRIEMVVPWEFVHGPRAFEWYAASNWFSQLANTTHYRVDLAPSEGLAKFPQ